LFRQSFIARPFVNTLNPSHVRRTSLVPLRITASPIRSQHCPADPTFGSRAPQCKRSKQSDNQQWHRSVRL